MYKIIGADQREYGPITADQLRHWISEGRINGATRAQAEGEAGWKTVAELPEFAAALSVVPPPLSAAAHAAPIVMPVHAGPKTNQMAVWSMITGIISVLGCCCAVFGPVPIILGIISYSQIKNNPRQTGAGFAIAGIVLGIIAVILAIALLLVWLLSPESLPSPSSWPNWFKQ